MLAMELERGLGDGAARSERAKRVHKGRWGEGGLFKDGQRSSLQQHQWTYTDCRFGTLWQSPKGQ